LSIIVGQQVYDLREDEVPPIDYGTLGVRIRKWKKKEWMIFFRGENGGFRSIEEGWGRNLGTMVNQRCGEGRGNRNSLSGVEWSVVGSGFGDTVDGRRRVKLGY